ncbi:hypothetical protein [Flavobacterium sp. NKUCC04_CG]|uniref:tetratricopeptide repeat-containing sensor histidine kinase n=1 Tax=Flavobacterium sp. NKUCC04_CG TaxID=2842121 RepID=UPI001C5ADD7C|nr:hypothetical protein [Flavobacterium sp. NKUCC04_CG]MBW3518191.1 hypothetical protein [Flavobacterium sp. NKUCC04_CG]
MGKDYFIFILLLLICSILLVGCNSNNEHTINSTPPSFSKAYSYQNKADSFAQQNLNDSAYYYYLQSNSELLLIKDFANLTYNSIKISEIQFLSGDVIGSEETCTEALKYAPKDNVSYIIALYNNFGRNYLKLHDHDKAIEYYNKALHLNIDELSRITLKNNIAYTYIQKQHFELARQILDSLIDAPILKQHPLHYARTLDNLGLSLFRANPNTGLNELKRSLNIRDSLQFEHGLIESYANLSDYYLQKDPNLAKDYALKMYRLGQKLKNPDDELRALGLLIQTSNTDELRRWSQNYIDRSKSTNQTNQTAKNQFAKIKYDHQKETAENLELKTITAKQEIDIEREKNKRQILIFTLITIIVGVLWFIKNSQRRHQAEKAKQVYITETKISKKIHDELANDIYNIIAYTENFDLTSDTHKNRLLNDLEGAYNKTRNISSEYGSISFGDDFLNYLKSLLQEYNGKNLKLVSVGIDTIDWNSLTEIKKIAIYRVIQELLVNMKKHSKANLVSLKFEQVKGLLKINYSDNGTGIVNEKLIAKNGLTNAENRIKDIRGSFTFEIEINKGLKIFITIPV